MSGHRWALAAAVGLLAYAPVTDAFARSAPPVLVVGMARAIDGDTLDVDGTRIRLHGIDAPEVRQQCQAPAGEQWACGQRARAALTGWTGHGVVACVGRRHDRYHRLIAICWADADDLGYQMVANGWAVAYRRYSTDYVQEEERARVGRLGIWSGTFDMPSAWRTARRH